MARSCSRRRRRAGRCRRRHGDRANDLIQVGRVTGVTVEISSAIRPFHEIGQRYATELRSGNVSVRGRFDRAYLNGALLSLLLGEASGSAPAARGRSQLQHHAAVGKRGPAGYPVDAHAARREDRAVEPERAEDDFVMEGATFQALYATVADEQG